MKIRKQFSKGRPGAFLRRLSVLNFEGRLMFSFESYFRDPYTGPYALKKVDEFDYRERYLLCDGGMVAIIRGVDGWRVDDMRKPLLSRGHFLKMKTYKKYGNALSHVEMLNAKAIEKILQSA